MTMPGLSAPPGVVFDCNIFLQALAKPEGPAGRCLQITMSSKFTLFVSPFVINEIKDVTTRPKLVAKFKLRPERVQKLLDNLSKFAVLVPTVHEVWNYTRDPGDAHYVNLAVGRGANLIVSRDKDLLDLMTSIMPEAIDLRTRFPAVQILDPVEFIRAHAPST